MLSLIFQTTLKVKQNYLIGFKFWKIEHCVNSNWIHVTSVTESNERLLAAMLTFTKVFSYNHLNYLLCVGMLLETQS